MTLARDLGNGPRRAFGSALAPSINRRIEVPERITERPRRLNSDPGCDICGERIFYCDCEEAPKEGGLSASGPRD
jgi:hypothetical protein